MIVLAIETTADFCSAAVVDDRGVLVDRGFRHRMHLLDRMVADVDALLTDAGTSLQLVDAIAVGIGPGSFTGVRIGVMAAKTWAVALGKPLCGVSAHDALVAELGTTTGLLTVPVVRARPGSVYAAAYRHTTDGPVVIAEPVMVTPEELAELVGREPERACFLIGDGLVRSHDELVSALRASGVSCGSGSCGAPRASVIAQIAARRVEEGRASAPLELAPLYVGPAPVDRRAERFGPKATLSTY